MEKICGVNVSKIRLLFHPSPPIYCFFYFAEASASSWGVKGLFSILLGGMLLSSPFVSLT